ncbi:HD-GYP domain-containing protein [Pelotomaculum propionicicum]|uniref:3'3'-cGAMP-specific phosphodiesterase 3 n=1 Tax=Pelotomaculum propionicicum TaxID=258475 RepID=A0A4Y7RVF3_9FIRM|nr:HD domain-containing phosphohydrolase [Pelotomaculum propionicicum]TEB12709.1 3'3'-cGAMP-specific phosphodiesterase 3 [Pelotomaculum propionicicum]
MNYYEVFGSILAKYPAVEQHCRRVASLAKGISVILNLPNYKQLAFAAYIHDLGKTTWPPELFHKHPLLPFEWSLVTAHPIASENILNEIFPAVPAEVKAVVRGHHERPGGGGYPDGLLEPGLELLIVAACDTYDAITHNKEYPCGEALPVEYALQEVSKFAPRQIVEALTQCVWK